MSTGGAFSSAKPATGAAKAPAVQPVQVPLAIDETAVGTPDAGVLIPADPAPVATARAENRPRKVSDTFDLNAAASPAGKPPVRTALDAPARVPEKTVLGNDAGGGAAKDAVGAVAQLGVDTVAAMRSAQVPVEIMRAAEPFESLAGAAVATATADAVAPVTKVLSGVLAAFGFSPQSVNAPVEPVQPVALLALMALGSRRELEQSTSGLGRTSVASTSSVPAATLTVTPRRRSPLRPRFESVG